MSPRKAPSGILSFDAGDDDPSADPPAPVRVDANDDTPAKKVSTTKKAPAKKAPAPAKKAPAKKRTSSSSTRTKARRAAQRVDRQLTAPARREANQGLRIAGAMVALAVLFALLTNADTVAPILGGVGKALLWLRDPVPIPYRT